MSNLYLGDRAIFDKCRRPFKSLKKTEEAIPANWKTKVGGEGTVYVLSGIVGDDPLALTAFKGLRGHKRLTVGNHDHEVLITIKDSDIFESVGFIGVIEDRERKVFLCHYPLMDRMEFNRVAISSTVTFTTKPRRTTPDTRFPRQARAQLRGGRQRLHSGDA